MATRLSSSDTKNYTQIPNGNKTEDRDIALDEIDATAPITIGNTHSFKEVFGGLNKIIKAITSALQTLITDMSIKTDISRTLGTYGIVSTGKMTFSKSEYDRRTREITLKIDDVNIYTHGYLKGNSNTSAVEISRHLKNPVSLGKVMIWSHPSYSGNNETYITAIGYLEYPESGGTYLKLQLTGSWAYYSYDDIESSINIEYELW